MSRDSAWRGFLLGLILAAIAIPILECDGLGASSSGRLQQRGSSRASPRWRLAEKDEENTAASRQRARLGAKNSTVIGSIIKKPAVKTVKWAKVGIWLYFPPSVVLQHASERAYLPSAPVLVYPFSLLLSTAFFEMRNDQCRGCRMLWEGLCSAPRRCAASFRDISSTRRRCGLYWMFLMIRRVSCTLFWPPLLHRRELSNAFDPARNGERSPACKVLMLLCTTAHCAVRFVYNVCLLTACCLWAGGRRSKKVSA